MAPKASAIELSGSFKIGNSIPYLWANAPIRVGASCAFALIPTNATSLRS